MLAMNGTEVSSRSFIEQSIYNIYRLTVDGRIRTCVLLFTKQPDLHARPTHAVQCIQYRKKFKKINETAEDKDGIVILDYQTSSRIAPSPIPSFFEGYP